MWSSQINQGGGFADDFRIWDTGAHTLKATPYRGASGEAVMTVWRGHTLTGQIQADDAPNQLTLGTPGDEAYLTIDLGAPQHLVLDVSDSTFSGVDVQVLCPADWGLVDQQHLTAARRAR